MRKSPTRHHARYHRDLTIEKWERRVRNRTGGWGIDRQTVYTNRYNLRYADWDWELKGEHNRYNKTCIVWLEYAWYPRKSHHARYRDRRSYWKKYLKSNDVGTKFHFVHPYIT